MQNFDALIEAEKKIHILEAMLAALQSEHCPCKKVSQTLKAAKQCYVTLVDNIPDIVYVLNENGVIVSLNKAISYYGYTQQELIGKCFLEMVYPQDRAIVSKRYSAIIGKRKNSSRTKTIRFVAKTGNVRWFESNFTLRFSSAGQFMSQEGVCRDITESVKVKNYLVNDQKELENQVRFRTKELMQANEALQNEILQWRVTEKALRDREADLQMEKANLKEANTALKVLLKRREMDKNELEEKVLYNIKEFVQPYIDKLKMIDSDQHRQNLLAIIESNISDITSGFSRRLCLEFYNFTASELKVANFIRQGKKNRQIALLLGLSIRTIEAYRNSIRHKLRIQNKKINLRTFLLSIQ
ncbi:MAG: PAS domain S-box protein [Desulfobacteraceae bacterium]|nr:PAS domain S-box protein [Desulfobacteraceae bacterium]